MVYYFQCDLGYTINNNNYIRWRLIYIVPLLSITQGLNENNGLNSLLDNVSLEFENECDIISHSKYYTDQCRFSRNITGGKL